jgi:hypothetical protein
MVRMRTGSLSGLLGLALAFTAIGRTFAQEPQPAPSSTPQAAPSVSPADDSHSTTALVQTDPPVADTKNAPPQVALKPASVVTGKKGKQAYSGPMTVVELPPAPMLDQEGNQRQAPDGKLMFNPPIRQQRDKYGHPLFDQQGKPVMQTKDNLGYDENGKKLHALKEKPPKVITVSISRGTLTVDGMTGKAALNYEIKDLKYVYFYVPGVGTTVVSNSPFPGAVEQKKAFDDKTLTVTLGDHVVQLSSDARILGKTAESAFVLVDKNFIVPTKFPVMGYGSLRVPPYAWPGSKENQQLQGSAVEAPPLPVDLRPDPLLQACPPGQMRALGARTLPGQVAAPRPCMPIVPGGGETTTTSASQTASPMANTQTRK